MTAKKNEKSERLMIYENDGRIGMIDSVT